MSTRSHRTVAGVSAAIAGLLALIINAWLGWILWQGFRFDWYVHPPEPVFEGAFVLGDVFLTAFITAVVTVVITVKAVHHDWTEDKVRYDGPQDDPPGEDGEPRDLSAFTAASILRYGMFAAIFLSIAVAVLFVGAGTEVPGEQFLYIKIAVGVAAGVYTGWGVSVALVRGLASGTLVHAPDKSNVARLSLLGARHPTVVVAVVVVLTLVLGSGLFAITTDVDVADVLPRGDPNTEAAHNVTSDFKSAFTQESEVFFTVDPERCRQVSQEQLPYRRTAVQCDDIRDEVYVRAIDEFYRYLRQESAYEHQIALPSFYKLVNWTEAGGQRADDAAFGLPGTDPAGELRYATVHEGVWAAIPDAVTPTLSPNFKTAVGLYMVESDSELSQAEIGRQFMDARDNYLDWVERHGKYPVFVEDNKPLYGVDHPVANAHSSALAEEDFALLFPLIIGFIVAALWIAFRNPNAILVSGTTLVVGAVWTYGLMGHLEIPLNTLNLAVIPILLGNGIDYSIHMVTEFAEHKSELKSDEDSLRLAGGRAGFAMFIATTTTLVGLLIMTVSPSLLLAEMAVLAAFAMISIFLLSVVFIPAQLKLLKGTERMGATFERSELMPRMAAFVGRHRIAFTLVIVLLTAGALVSAQALTIEPFGDPTQNWPEDDPIRQEHEEGLRRFYNAPEPAKKANIIVFQGDLYDYDAHVYMEDLYFAFQDKSNIDVSTARHIPFVIDTWNTVKDGAAGAPLHLLQRDVVSRSDYYTASPDYPRTRQDIRATLDAAADSPLHTFGSLFINHPADDIGIMTFTVQGLTYEEAVESWNQVQAAMAEVEDGKPDHLRVAMVGNTATNVLFVQGQLPWLTYMTIGSLIAVAFLVAWFTRSWKATATISTLVVLTTIWTVGLLPPLDIGLAITLMLPIVFITAIGTDYGVHLLWNIKKTGDAWHTFGTTGKAVMFSAITDAGAFLIFSRTQNLAVRDAVLVTAFAIMTIFIATLLVVGLFYKVEEPEEERRPKAAQRQASGEGRRSPMAPKAEVVETRLAEGRGLDPDELT